MIPGKTDPGDEPPRHGGMPQAGDEDFRRLAAGAAGVVALTAIALAAAALLLHRFEAEGSPRMPSPSTLSRGAGSSEPRLEVSSGSELTRLRAIEDEVLETYSWNKGTDLFTIPIERAMELIAVEGLPSRDGAPR